LNAALNDLHLVHLYLRPTGIPTSLHTSQGISTTLGRVACDRTVITRTAVSGALSSDRIVR
jgi:hypothetical protein